MKNMKDDGAEINSGVTDGVVDLSPDHSIKDSSIINNSIGHSFSPLRTPPGPRPMGDSGVF